VSYTRAQYDQVVSFLHSRMGWAKPGSVSGQRTLREGGLPFYQRPSSLHCNLGGISVYSILPPLFEASTNSRRSPSGLLSCWWVVQLSESVCALT